MPFKSEKQRRYLWANEPEIARDWTDTYGSRIKKDDGGIMRVGLQWGGPGSGRDKQGYQSSHPSSQASQASHDRGGQQHRKEAARYETKRHHTGGDQSNVEANKLNIQKRIKSGQGEHGPDHLTHNIPSEKFKRITGKFPQFAKDHWLLKHTQPWFQKGTDINKKFFIEKVLGSKNFIKDWTEIDTEDELQALYNDWMLGRQEGRTDAYGNPMGGEGEGVVNPGAYMGYPSYQAWLAAQGRNVGSNTTAAATTTPPSVFQQSLTANTTGLPFKDYYVGGSPTAANLAWGQLFGVDPRTMGRTTWAEGGRIPAAFGGIMDTETGRRAYGLGSIFKKIGRAAKKVLKSPIAKGALLAGAGMWGLNKLGGIQGLRTMAGGTGWKGNLLKAALMQKDHPTKFDPWKLGIWGASALPLFMGGEKEDESSNFDYEDAKTKYWNEIMGIKKGVAQGNLKDLHKWSYLPVNYKDGGRIGLYKGGQSIPSDYTIEDAMLSTTHDKLGGITEVMKQADLSRAGDVGQFYAADGGRIGYDNGGSASDRYEAKIKELMDKGLSRELAEALVLSELSPDAYKILDKKDGGRIGYSHGGSHWYNPFSWFSREDVEKKVLGEDTSNKLKKRRERLEELKKELEGQAQGGRIGAQEGGLMDLGGMEKDYRETGGFVEIGGEEKADDVPARLSRNEFVMTADAVRGMGEGNIDKGASRMEDLMETLEVKGKRRQGASDMFEVSERLSAVV